MTKPTWKEIKKMSPSALVSLLNEAMSRNIERHQIRARFIKEGVSVSLAEWHQKYDPIEDGYGNIYHSSEDANIDWMCRDALRIHGWWF